MRILIAEDDATSRTMLAAALRKKRGHEVVLAVNGSEAWGELQKPDGPQLAIVDWLMPEMDGLDVVRRVRGLEHPLPPYLIMLTTKGEKSDIVAGLEAGADDYLTKPFHLGELWARVDVGLRTVEMQQRLIAQADELREALSQVRTLKGLIPICSFCKRMKDDQRYWRTVEDYVAAHTEALFSHGLCPECFEKHYPEDAT